MKLAGRIALLLAVGVLGFELGWQAAPQGKQVLTAMSTAENPIETFRTERQQLRAMERAQLSELAYDGGTDDEIRGMAQRRLIEIGSAEESESTLEGILSLRGYAGCVVTVQGDSVNVLVPKEIITRQDSSLILELVCRETQVQSGNVKIIPIN